MIDPWFVEKVLLLSVLIVATSFFSGSETALFSLSRVKREAMQSRGDPPDNLVLRLLSNPRRLIVTLILCNELVNISISTIMAGFGETAMHRLDVHREAIVTVVTAVVTVPVLVLLGDMTPKTLALRIAERWARFAARPLAFFGVLITPLRFVISLVANGILSIFRVSPAAPQSALREEEFRALVDVGVQEGELEKAERKLIHNVFEFGDRTVAEVMTPGDKVFMLPYELPLGRLVDAVARSRYSRVPIFRRGGKRDERHVVGIVHAKDLVGYRFGQLEGHTLQDLLRPPFFVPRSFKCDRLFREFQRRKTHIALVVDEYGRLLGLVTMEDLLEELFGEISDEKEAPPRPLG